MWVILSCYIYTKYDMKYLSNSKSIFPLSSKAFVKKKKNFNNRKKTCDSTSLYFFKSDLLFFYVFSFWFIAMCVRTLIIYGSYFPSSCLHGTQHPVGVNTKHSSYSTVRFPQYWLSVSDLLKVPQLAVFCKSGPKQKAFLFQETYPVWQIKHHKLFNIKKNELTSTLLAFLIFPWIGIYVFFFSN